MHSARSSGSRHGSSSATVTRQHTSQPSPAWPPGRRIASAIPPRSSTASPGCWARSTSDAVHTFHRRGMRRRRRRRGGPPHANEALLLAERNGGGDLVDARGRPLGGRDRRKPHRDLRGRLRFRENSSRRNARRAGSGRPPARRTTVTARGALPERIVAAAAALAIPLALRLLPLPRVLALCDRWPRVAPQPARPPVLSHRVRRWLAAGRG